MLLKVENITAALDAKTLRKVDEWLCRNYGDTDDLYGCRHGENWGKADAPCPDDEEGDDPNECPARCSERVIMPPKYTRDLNAAVALVEKCLSLNDEFNINRNSEDHYNVSISKYVPDKPVKEGEYDEWDCYGESAVKFNDLPTTLIRCLLTVMGIEEIQIKGDDE